MVKPSIFDVDTNPDKEKHTVTLYTTKGVSGVFVGHVKEFPGVVVQADSIEHVKDECTTSLDLLVSEYPELHDKLWPKHISAKQYTGIFKKGLEYRTIEVTVPSF
ncbi:MAG: hypothetical protein OK438_04060 [Thaumarchaeota archaeon]|nr:hypothetical protein [Nitrososphaerota archaeon]